MTEQILNHGILLGSRDSDWVGGTIPYVVNNPSGDWTSYLPSGEWQFIQNIELMACTTFSALNVIETLYKFNTGVCRNFSDRFSATMSGTMKTGNYLWKVADSIRQDGIVDEETWPVPQNLSWDSYYTTPPIEVINKAKKFLDEWEVNYEIIDVTKESLIYHLKQSQIQVVIPGHAIMNFFTNESIYHYFDSYSPFCKERKEDFVYALKYVLTKKEDMSLFEQLKANNSPDVYFIRDGRKFLVGNLDAFRVVGDPVKIKTVTPEELNAIPDSGLTLIAYKEE